MYVCMLYVCMYNIWPHSGSMTEKKFLHDGSKTACSPQTRILNCDREEGEGGNGEQAKCLYSDSMMDWSLTEAFSNLEVFDLALCVKKEVKRTRQ